MFMVTCCSAHRADEQHLGAQGQLADFTSSLKDPRDAERLGRLWRPGATPELATH
jgi:hypothetical protein